MSCFLYHHFIDGIQAHTLTRGNQRNNDSEITPEINTYPWWNELGERIIPADVINQSEQCYSGDKQRRIVRFVAAATRLSVISLQEHIHRHVYLWEIDAALLKSSINTNSFECQDNSHYGMTN